MKKEDLLKILEKGILAPSGDNMQPWRFEVSDNQVDLFIKPNPAGHFFETGYRTLYLSAGAVIENIRVAAAFYRYSVSVGYFPEEENELKIAKLTFDSIERDSESNGISRHYEVLEKRCTNRKIFDPKKKISEETYQNINQVLSQEESAELLWIKKEDPRYSQLTNLICEADQLRFENERVHMEFMESVRFNAQSAKETRDGLDVDTLEAGKAGPFIFRLLNSWKRLRFFNLLGFSKVLAGNTKAQMASSEAVGFVVTPMNSPKDYVVGGEVMERIWHEITSQGLSLQPMEGIPVFLINSIFEKKPTFVGAQHAQVKRIKKEFHSLFGINGQMGLILLFRVGYSEPPSARALRRPLEHLIINKETKNDRKN